MFSKIKKLKIIPIICGTLSSSLAALVLLGWHTENRALVQIHPEFVPMQYNTALGLFLVGLGIIALSLNRPAIGRFCGIVIALLGLFSLSQYLLGMNLGMDEWLMNAYITVKTSHPGRMGPNTALCFVLVGAFFSLNRHRGSIPISLATAVLVLSLLAFVGYLTQMDSFYGWEDLTSMAVHTAFSFLVIGIGMFSLSIFSDSRRSYNLWRAAPLAFSTVIFILALLSWYGINESVNARTLEYFNRLIVQTEDGLKDRYQLYEQSLISGLGMFYASKIVERLEWRAYVKALNVEKTLPGINGIGYIDLVMTQDLDAYLLRAREDDSPGFSNHPQTSHPDKFIIKFIEPEAPNKQALGLDIGFESNRREAAEKARDQGLPMLTQKIELVQDNQKQPGFLLLVPVYKTKSTPETIEQRRAQLQGWVYAPFIGTNFLADLEKISSHQLNFAVYDGSETTPEALIFKTQTAPFERPGSTRFQLETPIDIAGRRWTVVWQAKNTFSPPENQNLSGIVLIFGIFLTLFAYFTLHYLIQSKRVIEKQVEKRTLELAESEERFRGVIESAVDGLIIFNSQGTIESSNPAFETMFDYSKNELIGANVNTLIKCPSGGQNNLFFPHQQATTNTGTSIKAREVKGIKKSGASFPIELSTSSIRLEGRTAFSAIVRDITNRKKAERALKEQEEKFRQTIKNAPIGIALVGLKGEWVQVNPALCAMIGYREDELLAMDFQRITHPDDLNSDLSLLKKLNEGTIQSYELEKRYFHKNGETIWILLTVGAVRDESQSPLYYVSQILDISIRKKAEENAKAARAFQDLILRTIPDLVFVKDEQLRIVQANKAFMNLYPPEKRASVIGSTTLEAYDPEMAESFIKDDREAMELGSKEVEETIEFPNGERRILATKKVRFHNAGQRFLLGISRDISQFRETQRELEQANVELEKFAYIASHDLKGPMRGIDSLAGWIAEDLKDVIDEDTQEKIDLMRQRITRLETLLDDILSYSRAGRIVDEPREVDSRAMVEDIVETMQVAKGFKVTISESLPTFITAYTPLHQVFSNLIANAYKHHDKEQGHIQVSHEDRGQYWCFSVKDDGPGISEKFHQRVFEMFRTLQSRDTTEGSGLGMAIIKKLVEWQDGRVWIESEDGKRGTNLRFLWPKMFKRGSRHHVG